MVVGAKNVPEMKGKWLFKKPDIKTFFKEKKTP